MHVTPPASPAGGDPGTQAGSSWSRWPACWSSALPGLPTVACGETDLRAQVGTRRRWPLVASSALPLLPSFLSQPLILLYPGAWAGRLQLVLGTAYQVRTSRLLSPRAASLVPSGEPRLHPRRWLWLVPTALDGQRGNEAQRRLAWGLEELGGPSRAWEPLHFAGLGTTSPKGLRRCPL